MSLLARLLPPRPSAVQTPADSDAQRLRDPGALTGHRWSFRSAGRRFMGLLAQYQWWILGVAGVVVFVLGYIGSWQFLTEEYPKAHMNFSDPAYLSLKDFVMESTEKPGLPWQLGV